ncbi:MAG TPA: formate dehydrogenase subunit alpha, partial [Candidatus Acidoferrum sp.]|nr:formate dehydrogenase subunit alpha [Candidatus Acidoferrum sp.]
LALGNVGRSGGGCNVYRGHDNVQGATDVGPNPDTLPGYYPVAVPGSWVHWAKVWNVDLEWLKKQYASEALMARPGMTVSRWIDGVTERNEVIDQDSNLRMIFFWGHAPNSQTRGSEMIEAMKKLDLMVVLDPYPSASAAMFAKVRKDGAYLLPVATQFETEGSVTASNRSLQWRERVIEPLFESRTDHMIMYQLAQKLGFGDQFIGKKDGKQLLRLVKGKGGMDEPSMEDTLRNEINAGCWTIGYTGQSPERLQAHMRNMHVFDVKSTRAKGGKDAKTGYDLTGDYYGLPWPCYGSAKIKHPGTPLLYDTHKHPMDGGHAFRALFGVEKDGVNLLAEDGVHNPGSDITTGYPQFDHVLLKKLGWWDELTDEEKTAAEGKTWANDLSGGIQRVAMKHGCTPFGNAKARAVVWNWPDAIPQHREPLFSPSASLVEKYPTHDDVKVFWRLPTLFKSVQQQAVKDGTEKKFPLILTSGRLVEYEGGGEETRSNPWLAELQQDNFVEINPKAAADRGIRDGEYVWVSTPGRNGDGSNPRLKVKAMVTERVGPDTCFIPFHFSGWWQGEDMLPYYPEGAAPIVRGEAVNTATTYGYDRITMMQETKTTLCQVAKA